MNAPPSRQRRADRVGRRAETVAVWWLRLHGWRILHRRLRTGAIELDIVAQRGRTIALVEVKYRRTLDAAAFAATPQTVARLRQAAGQVGPLLARRARVPNATVRCDLLLLAPFSWPRHLTNIAL